MIKFLPIYEIGSYFTSFQVGREPYFSLKSSLGDVVVVVVVVPFGADGSIDMWLRNFFYFFFAFSSDSSLEIIIFMQCSLLLKLSQ